MGISASLGKTENIIVIGVLLNLAVKVMLGCNFELGISHLNFDREVRGKVIVIDVLLNLTMN